MNTEHSGRLKAQMWALEEDLESANSKFCKHHATPGALPPAPPCPACELDSLRDLVREAEPLIVCSDPQSCCPVWIESLQKSFKCTNCELKDKLKKALKDA